MSKEALQGSINHFGPRKAEVDSSADVDNLIRKIAQPIYTTAGSLLCNTALNTSDTVNVIPANSFILSCAIYVEDAFTSTSAATGIDVGLVQADDGSTEIDFDGLIAVGGVGAKANLVATSWDAGDGALIGAETGDEDGIIYAKWATGGASDTLTGTGVVVVEFIPPLTHLLAHKT